MIARRLAALAPPLLAAALALACQSSPAPAASATAGAAVQPAAAIQPAEAAAAMPAAETTVGEGEAPCYRVQPLDERRRRIECANGDRFTIRLADDGKWYPENKVRAGLVPGHASPEAAGKALCGCGS